MSGRRVSRKAAFVVIWRRGYLDERLNLCHFGEHIDQVIQPYEVAVLVVPNDPLRTVIDFHIARKDHGFGKID